jgi:haloacetate dehalogenase|tara:strand:+ start:1963 stop:2862 length:900 start_codon:yes stop_codon:yes gene_type:complete
MFEGFERDRRQVNGVDINFVEGGSGTPLLLLHGYPQTHVLWHKVAAQLVDSYRLVVPDMRGYGDSSKPTAAPGDHTVYCKRTLAEDMVALLDDLDITACHVVGHDRGVRVGHRLALDCPERVLSLTSLDVVATQAVFDGMDAQLALAFFHWVLMRQPHPVPETLIGNSVKFYFDFLMERWCATEGAITPEAMAEYERCFCNQEAVNATVAEYRASELDLEHDQADRGRKLACPVLVLWGGNTSKRPGWQTGKNMQVLDTWRQRAHEVRGKVLDCAHFVPEERPDEVVAELRAFLADIGA